MIQDKTQSAENGRALFKGGNAVLEHPGGSLWTSAAQLAEPINIALQEYRK